MIHCFDTSAINKLLDDPELEAIVITLLGTGSIRVTAFNIVEIHKTEDESRRSLLAQLLRRLSNNRPPLPRPNDVVTSVVRAFRSGEKSVRLRPIDESDGIAVALDQPELVDDDARAELSAFAEGWDNAFDEIVFGDRPAYQAAIPGWESDIPRTPGQTIRDAFKREDNIVQLGSALYERCTGLKISRPECLRLFNESTLRLYFAAYGYGLHRRSIQTQGYSKHRNASGMDLFQAVYLQMCDRFVTNDKPQYRALRLLNKFNSKRKTMVLTYESFRRRLFPLQDLKG